MLDWSGVAIGAATLLIIGIFHPVVVACEYYLTDKVWPAFLVAGLACFGASLWAGDAVVSGILGVLGCTLVWCVRELKEQTQRVAKGWARRHPKRARDARLRRRAVSIDESTLLDDAGMPRQDALASMRGLTSRKVPFFIVSARAPRDVYAILDAHGIRCPVIAHGGAAIFDEGRALISSRGMGPGEVVDVLAFVGTRVPCHAWHACPIEDRASIGGPAPCPVPEDVLVGLKGDVLALSITCGPDELDRLDGPLGDAFPRLSVVRSSGDALDIRRSGVEERGAVAWLCGRLGVALEDVVALDDLDDEGLSAPVDTC